MTPVPSTDPKRDGGERLAHIDVLRAVACLSVVVHHGLSSLAAPADGILARWLDLFDLGRIGVLLFFIISGYCIGMSLPAYPSHHIRSFAISRLFRLYPAYWLSIIPVVFIWWPNVPPAQFLWNATMLQSFAGVPDVNGVFWTLAVELTFYGLCVGLYLTGVLTSRRRLLATAALLTGLALAAVVLRQWGLRLPVAYPLFLALMVGGAGLRCRDNEGARDGAIWAAASLSFLAVVLVVSLLLFPEASPAGSWYRHFSGFAVAMALFAILAYVVPLRVPALVYIGRISYSLYLLHPLMHHGVAMVLPSGDLHPALVPILSLPAAVAFAALSYEMLEKPMVKAGRRLIRQLQANSSARCSVPLQGTNS